jgi:endonuclease/exonuclease/phosphatase (EEP) superfamily protein YafD
VPPARRRTPGLVSTLLITLALVAGIPQEAHAASPAATTTVGTFFWANAWAAHHTAAHGASSGPARMRRMVRLLERGHVDLGALAEVEHGQVVAFRRSAPAYRIFTGGRGATTAVFWDADAYELVDAYRFRSFTYGGRRVRVPVAVLRHRSTDRLLGVIAVHDPRDRWRDRALGRELQEVRRLRRAHGGRLSVLVAGDFNAGASVACRAHRAGLYSVGNRRCGRHAPIDQLLVDRHVRASGYRSISRSRAGGVTDHPAVYRARFSIGT